MASNLPAGVDQFDVYCRLLDKKVRKYSGKPFKSGLKAATPLSIVNNPYTQRLAFIFVEDDSIVDCRICKEIK